MPLSSQILLEIMPDGKEGKEITFLNIFQKSSDVFLLASRNKILGFYKLYVPNFFLWNVLFSFRAGILTISSLLYNYHR